MNQKDIDNYFRDNPIKEIVPGLYSIVLPPASANVLEHVFDHSSIGHVWIEDCGWGHMQLEWVKNHLPTCFGELPEERQVQLRYVAADIIMKPSVFIKYLDRFDNGLELVYSKKVKPFGMSLHTIPLANRPKLFEQNHIEFYYSLPHRCEYSLVQSTQMSYLEKFIDAIKKKP